MQRSQHIHTPLCLQHLSEPDAAHLCSAVAFETFSYWGLSITLYFHYSINDPVEFSGTTPENWSPALGMITEYKSICNSCFESDLSVLFYKATVLINFTKHEWKRM